jgi:hypothetical protein
MRRLLLRDVKRYKPMRKSLVFALLLLLSFAGSRSNAQEKAAANPAIAAREPMLVTVDWLADRLLDP